MPKQSSYMTRALRSRDPRFARILGKLGYERADMVAAEPVLAPVPEQPDEIAVLRAEYKALVGRRPFPGWSKEMLLEKMEKARKNE